MKTSSAKAKGRRLQNTLRDVVLTSFPELTARDVKCAIMGESGDDLYLSNAALTRFPFDGIECKNVERLNVWQAIAQLTARGGQRPLLVFARNKLQAWTAMPLAVLMKFLREQQRMRRTIGEQRSEIVELQRQLEDRNTRLIVRSPLD